MKRQLLLLIAACSVSVGLVRPAGAGVLGDVAGVCGASTAVVIDAPEGVLLNSLWRCPKHYQHSIAEAFGDEHGLFQNVAGVVMGIPYGVVVGVPVGAIQGTRHGWTSGWDKPFSSDSFIVPDEESK
jgi:hypothetical protein